MKVNELSELEVTDVALGGKALARHEGRVVFVDRGLPGDRVTARITRVKRSWAEARLERVERPSGRRVAAPCPHFTAGVCGGCRFLDLGYADQLALKERQVRETLQHLGGIAEPPVRAIRPAPATTGYRNKMEFSFHPDADGAPVLGLHERGTFESVFALETCELPSPLTVEIVRLTRRFAAEHRWRAYHPQRHEGVVRYLTVRHLPHTGQCGVHLVAVSDEVRGLAEWAQAVAALSNEVRTVTLLLNRSRSNVAFGEEERPLVGDGVVVERLLGLEFEATANTFLQTNSRQAEALYAAALEAAALRPHETALDLYCGTGTLTLLLARSAARVVGVESVTDAVERARRNAGRNGIENVEFVAGESRPVLRAWARGEMPSPWAGAAAGSADATAGGGVGTDTAAAGGSGRGGPGRGPDVVLVDPPRAGLHPRVVFRIAELAPARIVYVSCNPATLARDLKDFATHGWRLAEVTPFDMFPHTPHIECVARLERG
jgi:23S rRNA (uracil1939-C5)-methyltransferase